MPPAARITDFHACPKVNPGPVPHVGGPVIAGEPTVIIGNQPAARVGDKAQCVPAVDSISAGEPSVIIGYQDAARMGDPTSHGGRIAKGCPTVLIGSNPQIETLKTDKPFCEECEKKKREQEEQRKRGRA
jgi:uncharacterized Zn-binding protein involved in type VI secretion